MTSPTAQHNRRQPASRRTVTWNLVNTPRFLAEGAVDGLYLLDAGSTSDGVQLTQVFDTRLTPAVLHPSHPLDPYGWAAWRQLGDRTPKLPTKTRPPDPADPQEAPVLFVLGEEYLINAGIDGRGVRIGRVFNRTTNTVSTSYNVNSLLTGYWTDFDGDADPIIAETNEATWMGLQATPPPLPPRQPAPTAPSADLQARLKAHAKNRRPTTKGQPTT